MADTPPKEQLRQLDNKLQLTSDEERFFAHLLKQVAQRNGLTAPLQLLLVENQHGVQAFASADHEVGDTAEPILARLSRALGRLQETQEDTSRTLHQAQSLESENQSKLLHIIDELSFEHPRRQQIRSALRLS